MFGNALIVSRVWDKFGDRHVAGGADDLWNSLPDRRTVDPEPATLTLCAGASSIVPIRPMRNAAGHHHARWHKIIDRSVSARA
jgi:hypothetical protein